MDSDRVNMRSNLEQRARHAFAKWKVGALVALGLLVGSCGDELYVGEGRCPVAPDGSPDCLSAELDLTGQPVEVSARSTTLLTPIWTKEVFAFEDHSAPAADGGLWLTGARVNVNSMVIQHMSAEGELGPEVTIVGPMPGENRALLAIVNEMSDQGSGPFLMVTWHENSNSRADCDGNPIVPGMQYKPCKSTVELLVFDATNLATPTRVDPCRHRPRDCAVTTAWRSGDGQALLVAYSDGTLELLDLAGQSVSQKTLPQGFSPTDGVAVDGARWVLFGSGPNQATPLWRGLLAVDSNGAPSAAVLRGADLSLVTTAGRVFRGNAPGEVVTIVERAAQGGIAGGGDRDGDLSVLRSNGANVLNHHLLAREDFTMVLMSASADVQGTVYALVHTGARTDLLEDNLTPVLCRFPRDKGAACFLLPWQMHDWQSRPRGVLASGPGFVFLTSNRGLARFELPL